MNRKGIMGMIALAALLLVALLTVILGNRLWSLDGVRALQALGGWLKLPMRIFTFLGDDLFYLTAIPLVYWCIHKSLGADLGALLVLSSVANGVVKSFVKHSRPFWEDKTLELSAATSFSSPSGHAQSSAALFGYLAWFLARRRREILWIVMLTLVIILVALSRVYLGDHFPGDVLWGAVVGLGLAALYAWLKPVLLPWLRQLALGMHVLLALIAAVVILVVEALLLAIPFGTGRMFSDLYTAAWSTTLDEAASVAGLAFGLWVGLAAESRYVHFSVAGPFWQRALRYLIGVAGLFAIWFGLRFIFPQDPLLLGLASRVVRYGLAMLWAILVWPWLFLKIGLGARERQDYLSGDAA
jgi:membrane-associated phospholipid phosphatase